MMLKFVSIVVLSFAFAWQVFVVSAAWPEDCKFTVGENSFDLSGLKAAQDYSVFVAPVTTYYINVCQATVTQLCGAGSGSCQVWNQQICASGGYGCASLGSVSTLTSANLALSGSTAQGLTLFFKEGRDGRDFQIDFTCNPNAGAGTPVFVKQPDGSLHYDFTWDTAHACPLAVGGAGGLSGGWIFVIILLCLVVVYIVAGIILNKFVRHQSGLDLIPNFEFWKSLPGLVKDGVFFILRPCLGNRGGYTNV